MPIYEFQKKDGTIVEGIFSIKKIPEEIVCEDGEIAKRILPTTPPGIVWHCTPGMGEIIKRKENMTKQNINAGKRGEKEWRERLKRKNTHSPDKDL